MGFLILNGVLYSIGWLVCVLCGAAGLSWPPIVFTAVVVPGQLLYLRRNDWRICSVDCLLLVYGALLGLLLELFFINSGILIYQTPNQLWSALPPGWIWSLYFLFALTFNHSLHYLNAHWILPAILGALGGPVTYFAGSELGAVQIPHPSTYALLALAWAGYLTLLFAINRQLLCASAPLFDQAALRRPLTVFYDPICPICSREINHLMTRSHTGDVIFHPIGSKEAFEREVSEIGYLDAMKEIHGLDAERRILKGVDVFSQLYARTDLPFLALLLESPGFHTLSRIGYHFWAKWRLSNRCKIQSLK